jgi:hypothetical protein
MYVHIGMQREGSGYLQAGISRNEGSNVGRGETAVVIVSLRPAMRPVQALGQ